MNFKATYSQVRNTKCLNFKIIPNSLSMRARYGYGESRRNMSKYLSSAVQKLQENVDFHGTVSFCLLTFSCRCENICERPDIYFLHYTVWRWPKIFFVSGTFDYKRSINTNDLNLSRQYSKPKPTFGCSGDFAVVALYYMNFYNLQFPSTAEEARSLYDRLNAFTNNI